MGEMQPIVRPSDTKKAVKEFLALGFEVDWDTATGLVKIRQPAQSGLRDEFDMIDMRRK